MHVTAANRDKNPNPQGKGNLPTLRDLGDFSAAGVRRKTPVEFFRDYCVSSLVLAARFDFRPVVGRTYYLYSREQGWMLSLVAPQEWGQNLPGDFVAACALRPDMTWEVRFDDLADAPQVTDKLQAFVDAFTSALHEQDDVAAHLPRFVAHLPYYRRLLASSLAASLDLSSPPQQALRQLLDSSAPLLRLRDAPRD
ncbi:MAG: hypothetical protein CME59_04885 [Halioglobus sp.]|nr:hypothetical protein [Halioglobus sp.]|tara:strand:- start:586 stop:1173 length:588 start_codon:yes stop_codon:yes gene_type:complete